MSLSDAMLGQAAAGGALFAFLLFFAFIFLFVAGMWKVYAKAGAPGWGALVPVYNLYLLCRIAGRPGWWLVLFVLPIIGLIPAIVIPMDIARNFGKGIGFGLGLMFFGFFFYPILGFGSSQYLPLESAAFDDGPTFTPDEHAATPPLAPAGGRLI